MQERTPLRTFRFANECHLGFLWKSIALTGVTRNTRADDILPGGGSAAVARDDVVEIQVVTIESDAAILAGILVALENIVAGELYFFFRKPIEKKQHNDPRHPDLPENGLYQFVIWGAG